ncbi:hypothetical protein [Rhodopirellula europaea]|uniref:hypothetical protein n=1 Tax=Rhodopirellula europaea TaxID=1263866 RepID=UPI003D2850C3
MNDDTYNVYYPSGNHLEAFARFHGMKNTGQGWIVTLELLENKVFNGQAMSAGSMMVIDPRCVVVDSSGKIAYTPRPNISRIDSNFQQWLNENRDWPDRLKLAP